MLTEQMLRTIRQRCEKASSGPWISFIEGRDHESGSSFIRTAEGNDIELIGATDDDQDFIASSRQDVIVLLDEIEELKCILAIKELGGF